MIIDEIVKEVIPYAEQYNIHIFWEFDMMDSMYKILFDKSPIFAKYYLTSGIDERDKKWVKKEFINRIDKLNSISKEKENKSK